MRQVAYSTAIARLRFSWNSNSEPRGELIPETGDALVCLSDDEDQPASVGLQCLCWL